MKKSIFFLNNEFLFPDKELQINFTEDLKKIFWEIRNNKEENFFLIFPIKDNKFPRRKNEKEKDLIGIAAEFKLQIFFNEKFDASSSSSFINSLKKVKVRGIKKVLLSDIDKKENGIYVSNYTELAEEKINKKNRDRVYKDFLSNLNLIIESANVNVTEEDISSPLTMIRGDISNLIYFIVQNGKNIKWHDKLKIFNSNKIDDSFDLLLSSLSINLEEETYENVGVEGDEHDLFSKNIKIIEEKLGRQRDPDVKKYIKQIKENPYPDHVKSMIIDELNNYSFTHSSEAGVIKQHIGWLLNLPWWQKNDEIKLEDSKYIESARKTLDSHYGLKKVKDRIIEYLVAKERAGKESLGQIICLVGPAGVGKTSIASSIAKAIGRKFVQISLAGINDVNEIKGHRKTYIGSEPGMIIRKIKDAGCKNPIFLINEIDKVADYSKTSVLNSLLEVLDPEQNKYFVDNYLEASFDLSEVIFICTANNLQFPDPILNRMEIIEVSSYTRNEKFIIASNYLLPRIKEEYKVIDGEIEFDEEAIYDLIDFYTREAGVRQLNLRLKEIFRKIFVEQRESNNKLNNIVVAKDSINKYLDKKINSFTKKQKELLPGVSTGLAYTGQGGDILLIEVAKYLKQGGGFDLTGNLGDIMKESARIAFNYIRTNCDKFGINSEIFSNYALHIHVPEGAIPKEGPSAGIALTTAIISCLTNKAISSDVGMTGEITLLGSVEAIGGLREKSIAAERSKLKEIIIPEENKSDIIDIPDEVKQNIRIHMVKNYSDVWNILFAEKKEII